MSTSEHGESPRLRALRGATSVDRNDRDHIVAATGALLKEMMSRNGVAARDIVSLLFTATPDLTAEFPAVAARSLGLSTVALLCASEIAVPGATPRCIRVLAHCYTSLDAHDLRHVYLGEARKLRDDLTE
jgi:chorismate mutase